MADRASNNTRQEYRVSRTKLQQGYLLGGVLVLIGVVVFAIGGIPDATLIGAGHVLVGGGIIGYTLRQSRDQTPRLVLDGEGIWYREWKIRPVPWAQIASVGTSGSRMSSFVSIELRDESTFLHILSPEDRHKIKSNSLIRLPRLFIPNHSVDAPFEELAGEIEAARKRHAG